MNFIFTSKQKISIALFLFFIIIITQSHILKFFFNNSLGRVFFILFIFSIAYFNNILGVISVLFAILLINNYENNWIKGFLEGFTDSSSPTNSTSNLESNSNLLKDSSGNLVNLDISGNKVPIDVSGNSISTSSNNNMVPSTNNNKSIDLEKEIDKVKNSLDISGNLAIEGFDILGMENNLKRGKKSNSIPISNQTRKSENVDPYYQSYFGDSFSYI
jgi:hypothetical protein